MHKKSAPTHNLSWSEAVDEALCFGWIDSTKRSVDDEKFIQYYGKRKAKSIWSKINKDKVEVLIAAGKMAPAGLESIAIAKKNGYWTLMDEVEELIVPEDLEQAFLRHPGAKEYYLGLSKSGKKGLLAWIVMARRADTREKRIREVAESAAEGSMPKHFR